MINAIKGIILSCMITVAVEASVASTFLIKKKEYKYIVIINMISNITLNVFYHLIALLNNNVINTTYIIVGEIIVLYVEAYYFSKYIKLNVNKYYFSFLLNSVSFITGLIIH